MRNETHRDNSSNTCVTRIRTAEGPSSDSTSGKMQKRIDITTMHIYVHSVDCELYSHCLSHIYTDARSCAKIKYIIFTMNAICGHWDTAGMRSWIHNRERDSICHSKMNCHFMKNVSVLVLTSQFNLFVVVDVDLWWTMVKICVVTCDIISQKTHLFLQYLQNQQLLKYFLTLK